MEPTAASTFLNYDCANPSRVRDHITHYGLKQHFPEAHAEIVEKNPNPEPYQVWEEFDQRGDSEHALQQRWLSGRSISSSAQPCSLYHRCGKIIVWHRAGHIYWRWTGYQDKEKKPHPAHEVPFQLPSAHALKYMHVCSEAEAAFLLVRCSDEGFAKLGKLCLLPRGSTSSQEFDRPEFREPVLFGWKNLHRGHVSEDEKQPCGPLDVYDIRTGEHCGRIHDEAGYPQSRIGNFVDVRIVRLHGMEVVMTLCFNPKQAYPMDNTEVRFVMHDGSLIQSIRFRCLGLPDDRRKLVVSERRDEELQFALVSYSQSSSSEAAALWEIFAPDETGRLSHVRKGIAARG
ncbi:hypothetical protein BDW74DRAFT_178057 [Aspergillus multicolor]|uniref:uncharacterized protein n=1 Tax=Aspergillus multicolor TaxID=41759 RepID=UPI003CCDEC36